MSHSAHMDLSGVRVLCIDGDPVIRSVVRFALQRHGCGDVVLAHGGPEALDLCAGRTFDLLICDFQMAPMTGLDFLRELAKSGLGEGWPVIMLSAVSEPDTIKEAHDLGVRAWLDKPVSAQALVENVGSVLHGLGQLRRSLPDTELQATAERHQARLMAGLRAAEQSAKGLGFRPLEAVMLAQALRHELDDINEHAGTLGYGLVTMLAARAMDLVVAMTRNPAAAARSHGGAARALGTLVTAMKRIAQNRMVGDGAMAGLILLEKIDGVVSPVRASLG
jgi:two-component system chemotaxis response regulator CheY